MTKTPLLTKFVASAVALSGVLLTQSAAANLVTNGGFETTVGNAGAIDGLEPASWTVVSDPQGFTFDNCGNLALAPPPYAGSCAMTFGSSTNGTISQTLATTPGVTYEISFYLDNFRATGGSPNNSFTVTFDGQQVYNISNIPEESYELISVTATAVSSDAVLSFSGFNVPDSDGLDNVSVVAAAPEPSEVSFMAFAATCAFCLRRFRTNRTKRA